MAHLYRPNQLPSLRASAAMLCAALGCALVLAASWPWLGTLGDMLFVGTLARGFTIGLVLSLVCARTGFAHARAAATIAGISTLLAIGGAHYEAHLHHRDERIADAKELLLQSVGYGRDPQDVQTEYKSTVAALTFANYLRAHFGLLEAGHPVRRDGAASKLGPALGISLYALELLLALFAAAYNPAGTASEPICPVCARWYRETPLPRAAYGTSSGVRAKLLAGESEAAVALLSPQDTKEYLALSLSSCPAQCSQAPLVIRLRDHYLPRSSQTLSARHCADIVLSDLEHSRIQAWARA